MSVTLKPEVLASFPNELVNHPKASNNVLVLMAALDAFSQINPQASGMVGAEFIAAFGEVCGWTQEETYAIAADCEIVARELQSMELTWPNRTLRPTQAGGVA